MPKFLFQFIKRKFAWFYKPLRRAIYYNFVDMPKAEEVMMALCTDNTAIVAINENLAVTANLVQSQLTRLETWYKKWRVIVNAVKSAHGHMKFSCGKLRLSQI